MKNTIKKYIPVAVASLGVLVFAFSLVVLGKDVNSKWDAISFAYADPTAVRWVKGSLEARTLNVRKELKEELVPQGTVSGQVSYYLSPVSK